MFVGMITDVNPLIRINYVFITEQIALLTLEVNHSPENTLKPQNHGVMSCLFLCGKQSPDGNYGFQFFFFDFWDLELNFV